MDNCRFDLIDNRKPRGMSNVITPMPAAEVNGGVDVASAKSERSPRHRWPTMSLP
jgi:hypothetical protein